MKARTIHARSDLSPITAPVRDLTRDVNQIQIPARAQNFEARPKEKRMRSLHPDCRVIGAALTGCVWATQLSLTRRLD